MGEEKRTGLAFGKYKGRSRNNTIFHEISRQKILQCMWLRQGIGRLSIVTCFQRCSKILKLKAQGRSRGGNSCDTMTDNTVQGLLW